MVIHAKPFKLDENISNLLFHLTNIKSAVKIQYCHYPDKRQVGHQCVANRCSVCYPFQTCGNICGNICGISMKWFLEQTINAEDFLLNNNTDCTVSSEIPEEDDSDILKANSLPSVPDPEFCVRTTKDMTTQGKSKELKKELSDNCY